MESGKPIVPQVEAYALKNRVKLPDSWKVDIAKQVKEGLLKNSSPIADGSQKVEAWKSLFQKFNS